MFDTTKEDIRDILKKIDQGKLQLPDFQRDYVWGDEDVKSLLASIAKGFPVGALLTLETGGHIEFKARFITGAEAKPVAPEDLLLDGQQRMTSLYQSTYAKAPVRTRTPRNTFVERFYYLDIKKSVSDTADLEDAIIGVPADKVVRKDFGKTIDLDLSTQNAEFEKDMFPLNQVFERKDWIYGWRDYWRNKGRDIYELEKCLDRDVLDTIDRYKMPIIRLDKTNTREAICLVFEKVNVGGKKLDAFELVTAIYAAGNFDLREDWNGIPKPLQPGRKARMTGLENRRDVLSQIASTDFLQGCTLLHTRDNRLAKIADGMTGKDIPQISCNRDALLGLPLPAYQKYADALEAGFIEAGSFLNELKIIWHRDIPYPPLIVGLASTFAILGHNAQTASAKQKLAQWFWSITFGELYGSSTESRLARDVPELVEWIANNGPRPRSLDEALFQRDRLKSLRSRLSAAYKGLHALMMKQGCEDFITGRGADLMTFFNDRIDIHHIFPQAWCKKNGIPPDDFNSIINKTPLSKYSNILISGDAPSVYLKRIEDRHGLSSETLDNLLRTHLIEPEHLRTDNFTAFFEARMHALATLVAKAMDKAVVQEHGTNETEIDDDASDEASNEQLEAVL
jgi:hypothetical protein